MERYSYKTKELAAEREKYRQDIAILESTEGWEKLTDKQKQIIKVSLYLQDRAERDMDPQHLNDSYYFDWWKKKGYKPKFQNSLEHIKKMYCHGAIAGLERGALADIKQLELDSNFFEAAYIPIFAEFDIRNALKFFGYPAVVHISVKEKDFNQLYAVSHSFLALGEDKKGNVVVWEKQGYKRPYRITTLQETYSDNNNLRYWGIRKLR